MWTKQKTAPLRPSKLRDPSDFFSTDDEWDWANADPAGKAGVATTRFFDHAGGGETADVHSSRLSVALDHERPAAESSVRLLDLWTYDGRWNDSPRTL